MNKLAVAIIISVLLTGCWDMREINELGMVMAAGVDKNSDGYTVTVQVANPKPTGTAGSDKSGIQETVWIASGEGKSLYDAVRQLNKVSSKNIMWAHNNVIIIGEAVAREGIIPTIDFFTHTPETRLKAFVAIAKGNASQYLTAAAGNEDITGMSFSEIFRFSERAAESIKTDMLKLCSNIYSDHTQPLLASIDFKNRLLPETGKPQKTVNLSGSAVFNKDKLAGFLTPEETRGVAWVRGATKNTLVTVVDPAHENNVVSIETRNVRTKILSYIEEDIPAITIQIKGFGQIVEEDAPTTMSINEMKNHLEILVNEKIASDIKLTLGKLQKDYESDVLGFGRIIHGQHKQEWNSGIKQDWESIFPEVPVSVVVDINIIGSSVKAKPMDIRKGEGSDESQDK